MNKRIETDGASALPATVYVGCRTTRERNARGRGLTAWHRDRATGALRLVQEIDGLVNPSYLALGPGGRVLYTVHGDASDISAFRVNPENGRLRFLNRQSTGGHNPVHLTMAPDGRYIVVSNMPITARCTPSRCCRRCPIPTPATTARRRSHLTLGGHRAHRVANGSH